ncbi:O-antigen ligase family protein [Hippea alviniae]|uniref:O-antigen ligase family protein n=1 Tax=Hippea alviniae TaxID=1279027 RepID=UPI0003B6EE64|nr:O-antigen ligase family protein [Hippea alviniae]
MAKFKRVAIFFITLSSYLFALTIPISIAGDNIAIGVASAGILLFLLSKDFKNYPLFRPLLIFLIPDVLTMISQMSLSFLKMSCLNHHLIPYFSSYKSFKEKKVFRNVINLLALSSMVLSVAIIFEAFTHQHLKHIDFYNLHFYFHPSEAWGFLNNHLTTSGVLLLLFFLFVGLSFYLKRVLYAVASLFIFIAIILAQARSAWLGFIVGVGFFSVLVPKTLLKKVGVFVVGLLLFMLLIFAFPTLKSRFMSSFKVNIGKRASGNINRIIIWKSYLNTFKNYTIKQKIFGAGRDTRDLVYKEFVVIFKNTIPANLKVKPEERFYGGISHNIYLRYLGETGIVGLLGYLLFWFYMLFLNFKAARESPRMKAIFYSFVGSYIAFLVMGFFENTFVDATIKMALMFVIGMNFYLMDEKEKSLE